MNWPLQRLVATSLALGLVLGMVPHAAPHCQSTAAGQPHQHGSAPKDMGSGDQCPHCPAAECTQHNQCAGGADNGVVASPSADRAWSNRAVVFSQVTVLVAISLQPPTPPPQLRV